MSTDFSQFLVQEDTPQQEKESFAKQGRRELARTGARIAESALGYPGDVIETGLRGINWVSKKVPGGNPKTDEEIEEISSGLPTSRNIRKFHEKQTGDYLKPQTPTEAAADDFFQLATTLALPGPKAIKQGTVLKGAAKGAGLAAVATGTKQGLKAIGVDEDSSNVAAFASMAVPSLLKGKGPKKVAEGLYKEADSLLPQGATVASRDLVPQMRHVISTLSKGTATPSKTAALKVARDVVQKSRGALIKVDELMAFKRDLNELAKDPALLRRGEKFLPQIGKAVDNAIGMYGQQNPQFLQKYRQANSMWGGLARSEKATSFLGKYTKFAKHPLAILALGFTPVGLTKAAIGWTGVKSAEIMHRILTNKELAKYYGNIIKSATQENAKATIHYLKKFDEKMEEEMPYIDWEQFSEK